MTRFQVDSGAVLDATAQAASIAARLAAEAEALHAQLTRLQDSWQGEASVAFQGVVEQWRTTQGRLGQSLDSINRALAAAGQQYADVEQANARMFSAAG